jgi:hypothetical protein
MVRVSSACARLAAGALLTAITVPAQAQNWDFENGSLSGWTNSGTAFWAQPTYGNNLPPRRPGETPGQQGNYWIGTYEYHPSPTYQLGRTQGDGPVGELLSDPFQINTRTIDFLVGGGDDIVNERVSLLVKVQPGDPPPGNPGAFRHLADGDYVTVLSSTGRNQEEMYRRVWDVTRWQGRAARILIVDNASGPWGHINADDFHVHPGLGTATVVQPLGTATVVQPQGSGSTPVYVPPVGNSGGASGHVIVSPPANDRPRYHELEVPQVQRDPVPAPGPGPSGHFQLIAVQFVANHQTRDDAVESDGPGDEIQVRSDNISFAPDGSFVSTDTKTSGIFGAPGRWDFVAGSAVPGFSPRADVGGIKSGDIYPRSIRPVRANGDLPMVLWDGVLERGGNGVVIIPSLWEIEDRGVSRAQRAWDDGLVRDRSLGASVVLAMNNTVEDNSSPVLDYLLPATVVFDDGNRPIGAAVHPFHFPGTGALPHDMGMKPQSIALTYDKAMFFASRRATAIELRPEPGVSVSDALPVPPGGIVMHFVDPPGNDGDYYLITQLVQVP